MERRRIFSQFIGDCDTLVIIGASVLMVGICGKIVVEVIVELYYYYEKRGRGKMTDMTVFYLFLYFGGGKMENYIFRPEIL